MTDHTEKECPKCGQQLRFPKHIGGMLMACPSCGKKFMSDFKLAGTSSGGQPGIITNVFEMPSKIMQRISQYFSS
jgi:DNA-directed RNA polymerase subunit RPC12/RpoP